MTSSDSHTTIFPSKIGSAIEQLVEYITPSNKNLGIVDIEVEFPSRVDGSILKFIGSALFPISGMIPYPGAEQ